MVNINHTTGFLFELKEKHWTYWVAHTYTHTHCRYPWKRLSTKKRELLKRDGSINYYTRAICRSLPAWYIKRSVMREREREKGGEKRRVQGDQLNEPLQNARKWRLHACARVHMHGDSFCSCDWVTRNVTANVPLFHAPKSPRCTLRASLCKIELIATLLDARPPLQFQRQFNFVLCREISSPRVKIIHPFTFITKLNPRERFHFGHFIRRAANFSFRWTRASRNRPPRRNKISATSR